MLPVLHLLLFLATTGNSNAADELDLNLFRQHDYHIKFERMVLARWNKDLVEDAFVITFKHNRTTAAVNITATFKVDVGYDMVGVVQGYKFMSNEYRDFPIRFSANTCKAIRADAAGLGDYIKCGNFHGCPFKKGIKYHVCNWFPNPAHFPPLIPNGEYKLSTQTLYMSQEIAVVDMFLTISRPIVVPD